MGKEQKKRGGLLKPIVVVVVLIVAVFVGSGVYAGITGNQDC